MAVRTQKPGEWEDVTLMNSKCSEASAEGSNSLFRAVMRSLREESCPTHHQRYDYYYRGELNCEECFRKRTATDPPNASPLSQPQLQQFCNLEMILNHPVLLLVDHNELQTHPPQLLELVLKSYRPLFARKNDFRVQRQLLLDFTSRLKQRVDALCQELISSLEEVESSLAREAELRDEMRSMSKMYEEQLLELLGEKYIEGTKTELEAVFQEYAHKNWNPFPKMLGNLQEMLNKLQENPHIDWQALTNLYTTVTDQRLWSTTKITSTFSHLHPKAQTAAIILHDERIPLQDQYELAYNEDGLKLKMGGTTIGQIEADIDSLYHLNKYKLLAVSYDKLQVVSYFDQLIIQEEYPISGCIDVLPFDDYIVAISKGRLLRIDRQDKTYEILGIDYQDLRYVVNSPHSYECCNADGLKVRWQLKKNKPCSTF